MSEFLWIDLILFATFLHHWVIYATVLCKSWWVINLHTCLGYFFKAYWKNILVCWAVIFLPLGLKCDNPGLSVTKWAAYSSCHSCTKQYYFQTQCSVQFSHSVVSDSMQPHESQHARPPCPSPTPKLMSIESVMPSSHLVLCRPLLLLPPIPPIIRVFSNESTLLMRWPKYWSFSFSISPSSEHPGLISCYSYWKVVLTFPFNLFTSIHPLNYLIVILWKFRVFLKSFSSKLSVRAGRS